MMHQHQETQVVVPIPDQLYLAVRDVFYAYKEWQGKVHIFDCGAYPYKNLTFANFIYSPVNFSIAKVELLRDSLKEMLFINILLYFHY